MYQIKIDGYYVYGTGSSENSIISPVLETEINQVGKLEFSIAPTNQRYAYLEELKSIAEVFDGDKLMWRGRVVTIEKDFDTMMSVSCEGVLGYLNDSIIRPLSSYSDYDDDFTMIRLVNWIIDRHNSQVGASKRIYVGNVTVGRMSGEDEELESDYLTTKEFLEKVREKHRGHFAVRYDGSRNLLDYIPAYTAVSIQPIHFGWNLLDFSDASNGESLCTSIIPLGKTIGSERINIADVNGGRDYLENTVAAAKYGRIFKVVTYDDIDDEDDLIKKAREELLSLTGAQRTITASALDLSITENLPTFRIGDTAAVLSPPHGIDAKLQISKIRLDLSSPDKSEVTLGAPASTITGQTGGASRSGTWN